MNLRIRPAVPADAAALAAIEAVCFPPAEAASLPALTARLERFADCFLVAEDAGTIIGFVGGCVTDAPTLPDVLYEDTSLHRPDGLWQTVFGLDVLPDYRRQGVARQLLQGLIDLARQRGKAGVVLTCKDHLVHYYASFGFQCKGVSTSTHGGAVWNDMVLTFPAAQN
jgi:GNAT superfamily N-acetyltransferase